VTAFMLACYMNGVAQGAIYFRSVSDCTYYTKFLDEQQYKTETGQKQLYECICKLVPQINPDKVRVY
tara:strand:+ start:202 stop:402 length:201 start_codon:yes stop_codon:yes gene_type:complete